MSAARPSAVVIQGASRRARDWAVLLAMVVPVVLRAVVGLRLASRGFAVMSVCFACLAAELAAAGFLTVVDGFGGARGLAASMTQLTNNLWSQQLMCASRQWHLSRQHFLRIFRRNTKSIRENIGSFFALSHAYL